MFHLAEEQMALHDCEAQQEFQLRGVFALKAAFAQPYLANSAAYPRAAAMSTTNRVVRHLSFQY